MEIPREPTGLYVERFCTAEDKNVPMEIVYGMLGGQAVRCLSEERCRARRGECENPLREYW